MSSALIDLAYLLAATLFVFAVKGLGHPRRAVRGNVLGSLGMVLAVGITLLDQRIVRFDVIVAGIVVGTVIGLLLAIKIKMTAMPELIALFNGVGGGASVLVAGSVMVATTPDLLTSASSAVSGLVGAVTFSGSLVAMAKLQGWLRGRGLPTAIQRALLVLLGVVSVLASAQLIREPTEVVAYGALVGVSLLLGILLVVPIGGADMPVVIAFLNACSGLAAAATGFVLMNQALVISGSLVGASGFILTGIMCRAMNRSFGNVLFGNVGAVIESDGGEEDSKPAKSISAEEVAMLLEAARRVIIVPGYGMAVAQAQHAVAELSRNLQARGIRVDYAIHPVAGRMPGHMNVLLAEADVPYDQLFDLDAINSEFVEADVVLIIGANDVVNPRARTDKNSPIYGMPIANADHARTVVILKRSMAAGFAGVGNPLFTADNATMLFGDAKKSIVAVDQALKEG
jgi:NAD(P) transhydrogenase subunit beta